MDFKLTDDQKMIANTVKEFVKSKLPLSRMRAMRENELGYDQSIWKEMGDLGWLAMSFSEDVGGFGGTFVESLLLLEHFGRSLVSEPYIASVVLAGRALAMVGSDTQRETFLTPMLSGDTSLAWAVDEKATRNDPSLCATSAAATDNGFRLKGEKTWVLNGHSCDAFVLSARTSGALGDHAGLSLFVVNASAKGVTVTPVKTMDGHRAAMVSFDLELPKAGLLGTLDEATVLIETIQDHGAAAACAEGYGVMQASVDMTVEYLQTREQFGKKIGTFQALQHRAVDMFLETQLCHSMAIMAAIKVSVPGDTETARIDRKRAISAAKVQLAAGGKYVTQQAIQLHGGIGVTDEHDIGLYFKRMHVLNSLFGDESFHVDRYRRLPTFQP